jgi:hypothetical protein
VCDESGQPGTAQSVRLLQNVADLSRLLGWLHGPLAGGFFVAGRRVELHPATDRWMMGDRYGEVIKVEPERVRVRLDKSRKSFWFRREDVLHPGNRNP